MALKFLRPEFLGRRDLASRFLEEARTAVKVKSENAVRVFDLGVTPDAGPFMVMDLLEGEDLASLLCRGERLPSELAAEYVLQACEGVAVAHSHGIVHRDIKPENLFLTRSAGGSDVVKVLDFGISKATLSLGMHNATPALTSTGVRFDVIGELEPGKSARQGPKSAFTETR